MPLLRTRGLGATLGGEQNIKNHFSSFKDFLGKADSVIFLGFECIINPQNLMMVGVIFEKINIFNFFLIGYELPLILRIDRRRKNKLENFSRVP